MARAKKEATTTTTAATATTTTPVVVESSATGTATASAEERSAVMPMRKAISYAHKLGNAHAIKLEEATYADVPSDDFHRWTYWVGELRTAAIEYGKLVEDKDADQKDLELAKTRLFVKWRSILKVGEENLFHKNLFIREQDAETIRVYATGVKWLAIDGIGSVMAQTGRDDFRRLVELLLGCRMAANKLLNDADRDMIIQYQSHQKAAQTAHDRLHGYSRGNTEVVGLYSQLKTAEDKLASACELLTTSIGEEAAKAVMDNNPAFSALRNQVAEINKQIDTNKKAEYTNKLWCNDHKRYYNAIISTLDSIEGKATR